MKKITKKDMASFQKSIRAWKNNFKDKEMVACYKKDRKDLRKVLSLIKKGKYSQAGKLAWDVDTIVREQIPQKVYNIIAEAYDNS